jgi:hypothetical protein
MCAKIYFHTYIDIQVITETVSRKKNEDYHSITLNPENEGTKLHLQSTGVAYA